MPERGAGVTPPARLHYPYRNDFANVLVTGGNSIERLRAITELHEEGGGRCGPLVVVDARRDEHALRRALEEWISDRCPEARSGLLGESNRGTLFIDSISCLTRGTQRLLLAFSLCSADKFLDDSQPMC
jgi:hypothetical protein